MVDNQRVCRLEAKTRFRFSSEGGVGEKTRFGGGRFVVGTPSLLSHKHTFFHIPHDIPTSHTTKKNRIDRNQSYLKHDLINLLN